MTGVFRPITRMVPLHEKRNALPSCAPVLASTIVVPQALRIANIMARMSILILRMGESKPCKALQKIKIASASRCMLYDLAELFLPVTLIRIRDQPLTASPPHCCSALRVRIKLNHMAGEFRSIARLV